MRNLYNLPYEYDNTYVLFFEKLYVDKIIQK